MLICMQKTNFITPLFLKIVKRNGKLILGALGMPGYANPKWYYQLVENVRVYLQAKNQLQSYAFLEIL